jgi:hypothetical protein
LWAIKDILAHVALAVDGAVFGGVVRRSCVAVVDE